MEYTFRWVGDAESVRLRGSIETAGHAELTRSGKDWATTLAPAQVVLDNLLAEGLIPPTAAILPDSVEHALRVRDLDESTDFLDWCVNRLLPWSGFEAPRERTVVGGSSFGGKASLFFAR